MSRAADDVKPSQESEEDGEKVDVVRQVAMAVIEFACTLHVPSMIDGTSAPVFVVDSVPYSALWTGKHCVCRNEAPAGLRASLAVAQSRCGITLVAG